METAYNTMGAQDRIVTQTAILDYSAADVHLQKMETFKHSTSTELQRISDASNAKLLEATNNAKAAIEYADRLMESVLGGIGRAQEAMLKAGAAQHRMLVSRVEQQRLSERHINYMMKRMGEEYADAQKNACDLPHLLSGQARAFVEQGAVFHAENGPQPRFWKNVHQVC